jgi:hypothetical protein
MTFLSLSPDRRPPFLLMLCLGAGIGALVALGLYATSTSSVALVPLAFIIGLPTLFLKNFRLYWFAIFLLSSQFLISKNLNDGLAVIDALKIDFIIDHFTFSVSVTDLALLVLLAIWTNDRLFHAKPFHFPPVSWLAVGYLGVALVSALAAPSRYLGLVEMSFQIKYFIGYLFAVNCLDSKSALRVLAVVAVIILVIQGGVAAMRFETGYLTPFLAGDSHQDPEQMREYWTVDRSDPDSAVRAFGTLGSPNATTRLCLLVIPFALFFCAQNPIFRMRLPFVVLTAFGLFGLVFTFTRVFFITTAVQIAIAFLIMVRDRLLKRSEIVLVVVLSLVLAAAVSPKLYKQFTVREDSISVRELQNEAAVAMILDQPFLGVGLNNAQDQMRKYSKVTYNKYDANTQFYSEPINNMFLSMAAEIGVFGTLLFVAFFAKAAFVAWRQSRYSTDPEIRFAANALVVAFCGVAANGVLDPFGEYQCMVLLWLYAGISLALPHITQRGEAADHRPADDRVG